MDEDLDAEKEKNQALIEQIEKLKAKLKTASARAAQLGQECADLKATNLLLNQAATNSATENQALTLRIEQIEKHNTDLNAKSPRVAQLEKANAAFDAENCRLKATVSETSGRIDEAKAQIDELNRANSRLKATVTELTRRFNEARTQIDELNPALKSAHARIHELETDNTSKIATIQALEAKIKELNAQIAKNQALAVAVRKRKVSLFLFV